MTTAVHLPVLSCGWVTACLRAGKLLEPPSFGGYCVWWNSYLEGANVMTSGPFPHGSDRWTSHQPEPLIPSELSRLDTGIDRILLREFRSTRAVDIAELIRELENRLRSTSSTMTQVGGECDRSIVGSFPF